MEDDNSMSERILRSLESIFKNDLELKEFSIVPTEGNTKNKSPVLYEDHNVGLESWCVKYVYRHAYMELFDVRSQLRKKKLSFCKERNLNHLLIGVLLINPDVSTFWNMKRELVCNNVLFVENELSFAKVVLSYKSKSNEAFAYRRWLLKRLVAKIPEADVVNPFNLLVNELNVCEMAAEKSLNNYHAWTHRIWCIEHLAERTASVDDVIGQEIAVNGLWLHSHVSEHTGYHYRQYLFDYVLTSSKISTVYENVYHAVVRNLGLVNDNDSASILICLMGKSKKNKTFEESSKLVNYLCLLLNDWFDTTQSINSLFPNHESLFYHRRYLIYSLLKTLHNYHDLSFSKCLKIENGLNDNLIDINGSCYSEGEKQPKMFKSQPSKVKTSFLYETVVKGEEDFIKKNVTNNVENNLAKKHEKWLNFILCLD